MTEHPFLTLHRTLTERFDEQELRTLCATTGLDYGHLPGEGTGGKARELIAYFNRRNQIQDLVVAIRKFRPDISEKELPQIVKTPLPQTGIHSFKKPVFAFCIGIILTLIIIFSIPNFESKNIDSQISNNQISLIGSIPLDVFYFSEPPSTGNLSINYDIHGEPSYTLQYLVPELQAGSSNSWAGVGMRFEPLNLAEYEYIELAIKFSDPKAKCQIKLMDKSSNPDYFTLGDIPPLNTGVTITNKGDYQIVKIPLRGNFDNINLEQVVEISFLASSDIGAGSHSFTFNHVSLQK